MSTLLWTLLFIGIVGGIELWTIRNERPNDTASVAFFWKARTYKYLLAALYGFCFWCMYHFFFEPLAAADTLIDDLWLTLGAATGTLIERTPRTGR